MNWSREHVLIVKIPEVCLEHLVDDLVERLSLGSQSASRDINVEEGTILAKRLDFFLQMGLEVVPQQTSLVFSNISEVLLGVRCSCTNVRQKHLQQKELGQLEVGIGRL